MANHETGSSESSAGNNGAATPRVSPGRWVAFCEAYPEYLDTGILDRLRHRDFDRLDAKGHIYLDYTGSGLYGDWQIRQHMALLQLQVLGNPHSSNPTSSAATAMVEHCRQHVLDFFHASPEEYAIVFTANASHALKLVGESYPFAAGDRFLLTFDNHNSVNGIREFDRARGARTTYVPVIPPDLRIDEDILDHHLADATSDANNLFAFPARSRVKLGREMASTSLASPWLTHPQNRTTRRSYRLRIHR